MKKRILLFGAGTTGQKTLSNIPAYMELIAFVDNDVTKQNTEISGYKIISPHDLINIQYDFIVLASSFVSQIVKQLLSLGIKKKQILISHFGSVSEWNHGIEEYENLYTYHENFYTHHDNFDVIKKNTISPSFLERYAHGIDHHSEISLIWELNRISMLSPHVLLLLRYMSMFAKGRILEIGSYIGGSTIALASGTKMTGKLPVISIEPGGSHLGHPDIPSKDIFSDLVNNIKKYDVDSYIHLIQGASYQSVVIDQVVQEIDHQTIGLIFIDSDGNVERDFSIYGKYLSKNCLIVLDDYDSDMSPEKTVLINVWVNELVERGILEQYRIFPWGTWFGRLRHNIWKETL